MNKANQDIRDYMKDHGVSQKMLAAKMCMNQTTLSLRMKSELSQKDKETMLNHIDAIAADLKKVACNDHLDEEQCETAEEIEQTDEADVAEENGDVSASTKFQVGDQVKIPSKQLTIGVVCDIWHSLVQDKVMYAVDIEGGSRGLYREDQLEPAPLPITYTFDAHIDGNVAVVVMNARQGDKTWIYSRGHAHIIHDGEVGMAQAVSYAARRMFETLDTKLENRIYFKGDK